MLSYTTFHLSKKSLYKLLIYTVKKNTKRRDNHIEIEKKRYKKKRNGQAKIYSKKKIKYKMRGKNTKRYIESSHNNRTLSP